MFGRMAGGSALVLSVLAAAGAASADFLLIPESTNDTVGKYDPYDGTYLGDFASVPLIFGTSSTPVNALLGPDGLVYVSDQVQDAVFRFDQAGTFRDVFADNGDGLNNIRGIDFRGDHLFVTSGDDYVAEFDAAGNFLGNFIQDGSSPFDIFFLPDGRSLLANAYATSDDIRLYEADGLSFTSLFLIAFPEQIQYMPSTGHYLNAAFSADFITEFDLDGSIVNQWFFNGGRGVFELGNGNLLATAGDGVWSMDPGTGGLTLVRGDVSGRFIELVPSGPTVPEDINGDGVVDVLDLLAVLAAWGAAGGPEDVNGDGVVDVLDLLAVLAAWS